MLDERAAELNTEQLTTGLPAASAHVYALFRCPGAPYDLKPWCWFNSQKQRRFELKTHHLRDLVKHVQRGNSLDTHDQVPEALRQQIYKADEQNQQRKRTTNTTASAPIQIANVLPTHAPVQAEIIPKELVSPIEPDGFRDVNVEAYGIWQKSQVSRVS